MRTRQRFALQSLLLTVALNAILLIGIYLVAGDALAAAGQTVTFFVIGIVLTVVLWLALYFVGGRLLAETPAAPPPAPRPTPASVQAQAPARPAPPVRTAEDGAVQMLAILQREGRFIDFLQEDLSMYDDAQIGAAVRSIHEGSRKALREHLRLEPIYEEAEGSTITVAPGFDAQTVRLTGNVAGDPPFTGALRHRGWRVASVELPQPSTARGRETVVAAAEVEVNP
jgi:hypothetical protein